MNKCFTCLTFLFENVSSKTLNIYMRIALLHRVTQYSSQSVTVKPNRLINGKLHFSTLQSAIAVVLMWCTSFSFLMYQVFVNRLKKYKLLDVLTKNTVLPMSVSNSVHCVLSLRCKNRSFTSVNCCLPFFRERLSFLFCE